MAGVRIGSNIASLQAQRNLADATAVYSKTMERLSTGQRINRASDDAAGLAIAGRLSADVRVLGQAKRNLSDGISHLTIADGALGELKGILTRVRELSTQASNGTYTTTQRQALDNEARQLEQEFNRIVQTSQFNGQNVFSVQNGKLTLQAGYGTACMLQAGPDDYHALANRDSRLMVNISASGQQANNECWDTYLSSDGRYVTFGTFADNLVPGHSPSEREVYRKDLLTGEVKAICVGLGGAAANGYTDSSAMSADGRYVAFYSDASNLVTSDTNGVFDIFVRDMDADQTVRVSTSSSGQQANAYSAFGDISEDGRYVVFTSDATNLVSGDTNGQADIFIKDLLTNETKLVSCSGTGERTNGASFGATVSADGRYILFTSAASNLVGSDTNGNQDVFLKDMATGQVQRVSTSSSGSQANSDSTGASLTLDGHYALYYSSATNLAGADTNGAVIDTFVKNLWSGETKLVSTNVLGLQDELDTYPGQISADGRFVVMKSWSDSFDPVADGSSQQVYVKDLFTNQMACVSVNAAGVVGDDLSDNPTITPDGRYIGFQSMVDNLVTPDDQSGMDIFLFANPLAEKSAVKPLLLGSISTQSGALYAQTCVDQHFEQLSQVQGVIGAAMNRLETAANTVYAMKENSAAAASRIIDADIAAESAVLARTAILQQSSVAVLAQANQQPAVALDLLQNI